MNSRGINKVNNNDHNVAMERSALFKMDSRGVPSFSGYVARRGLVPPTCNQKDQIYLEKIHYA